MPLVLVVDFITKRIVLANIETFQARIEVIGEWARFAYVRNPGAAMGLKVGGRPLLIAISVVASILLTIIYRRVSPDLALRRSALAAILGGALGNLIDRIFYQGLVVDFIDLGIGAHRFYTFNVADMGVSLGGVALFISLWLQSDQPPAEITDD
jgi:signal peptidase II